jgi:hypothetical protein
MGTSRFLVDRKGEARSRSFSRLCDPYPNEREDMSQSDRDRAEGFLPIIVAVQ